MNTIKGMIKDLRREETHIGGCTTKGELIIALESLERSVELPYNATNGDMIKAMFPNARVSETFISFNHDEVYYVPIDKVNGVTNEMRVMKSWWNAPYRKEVEE